MTTPIISIIVAMDDKQGIGKSNQLMWRIPSELSRFRTITTGHPIIMGRKTYESIGRPLPKRTNIIITRDKSYHVDGCTVVNSLKDAIAIAKKEDQIEIFIIGGGEIYKQAVPFAQKLYITKVQGDYGADTFFPDYSNFTKLISKEEHREGLYSFSYSILERK